ncbi:MAG: hypothetical protein OXR67_15070 [Chloroflexota bacterium]|nr:hypothetical protein [Chloroflexota bacterium]
MTDSTTSSDLRQSTLEIQCHSLCFGVDCFPEGAVQAIQTTRQLQGNHWEDSFSVAVLPPDDFRWDHHAEAKLSKVGDLIESGICIRSGREPGGSIEFLFHGYGWELGQATVTSIEFLRMSRKEAMYWLPLLSGLVSGVNLPGMKFNESRRPFLYAVPLKGLSVTDQVKSLTARDFGVTSGNDDKTFGPILANTELGRTTSFWEPDCPKAHGVVYAANFMEAEKLALERATFTADLIGFALRAGTSHFDTRYRSIQLAWDVEVGRSAISLEPWIFLMEEDSGKGWVRSIPLITRLTETSLEKGYERINLFANNFVHATPLGDSRIQTSERAQTKREKKLSSGIQRSLRWLSIASNEDNVTDRFMATWISLESILNSIEYPGVFDGKRVAERNLLNKKISEMSLPNQVDSPTTISEDLIKGRVLQNDWPLPRKLEMFARASGLQARPSDVQLIRKLSRLRGEIFHTGQNNPEVSKAEIRQLEYLVERLVISVSVGGYEDFEDETRHRLEWEKEEQHVGAEQAFLDGRRVTYREEGTEGVEYIIEGKIYSQRNTDIS